MDPTQCADAGSGVKPTVQNGWVCDTDLWWRNDDGTPKTLTRPDPTALVGDTYNLRDVDCLDGQVTTGVPVFVGSGQLGGAC